MSRFKILVFLLAVGIAGSVLAAAYWYYTRVLGHESVVQGQIKNLQGKHTNLPDPGVRRFDEAMELINNSNYTEGRKALYRLLDSFPETTAGPEARRIIGELNMDMLFSQEANPQRKDYIVQPGDSMGRIANKNQTSVECIMRANGMLSTNLQPGDHLFVFPLDFEIVVDLSSKTVQLWRGTREKGYFFKEYQALEIRLPPGMKAPAETVIQAKSAWHNGKSVTSENPIFISADKWLVGHKTGFNVRGLPKAKPLVDKTTNPSQPTAANKGKSKGGSKAANKVVDDDDDDLAGIPETGVFLAREDIEELFTIVRTQTKLFVAR
ncbi:LysM peptidoglycan-binding domain-containing protein [Verrucomicrobium sp. BvORR106]|uniref:LysM peptidoglycan-binding domain-containing protein n=1 Tax=Verrucomicrobium sp. BvORR106 TaxID=1403819 RepID=UPI00056E1353|nr:LysM peptidoglycan-binding domain-containing protein [Verrucomicrobium sp. BvORR106]